MTERAVELVPDLIRGQARDGRCKYDPSAKAELVRRCLQPGVSVAAMAQATKTVTAPLRVSKTTPPDVVMNAGRVPLYRACCSMNC